MRYQILIVEHICDLCGKKLTVHTPDIAIQPAGWSRKWILGQHTHAVAKNGKPIVGGRYLEFCEDHKVENGKVTEHLGKSTEEYTLYQQELGYTVRLNSYNSEAKN